MPFVKGKSGNVKGCPPGAFSLVRMIKQELQELDPETNDTYARTLVRSYILEAAKGKSNELKKDAIDRIDGKPTQTTKLQGDAESPLLMETTFRIVDTTKGE